MPTASPRRVSRLRCCFYSSTNSSAGLTPTPPSTTSRTSNTAQTASSNSPTTAPTKQSNTSSICSPPPDLLVVNVELFLSRSGSHVSGWTAKQILQTVLTPFHLSYGLNQLRYDLLNFKGHALIELYSLSLHDALPI